MKTNISVNYAAFYMLKNFAMFYKLNNAGLMMQLLCKFFSG